MAARRSPERIAYTLRALAADLAAERRRVLLLRRENRLLKAKLAALQYDLEHLNDGAGAGREDRPGGAERAPRW